MGCQAQPGAMAVQPKAAYTHHVSTPTPLTTPPQPAQPAPLQDLEAWERLDDVIMGGSSSSGLGPSADGSGAVWRGDLIVEVERRGALCRA
jgi:hypothetical protein